MYTLNKRQQDVLDQWHLKHKKEVVPPPTKPINGSSKCDTCDCMYPCGSVRSYDKAELYR